MGTRQRREGRGIIAPKRIIGPPGKTSPVEAVVEAGAVCFT